MKTLKQIELDALAIESALIAADGEVGPELEEILDLNQSNLEAKADSYSVIMERMKASSELMKARAEEYTKRARALANLAENLKTRIKETMLNLNLTEISGEYAKFKLSRTQPRLEIDEGKIPAEYCNIVQTVNIDKDKVKSDLKAGVQIEGARLIESYALRSYLNEAHGPTKRISDGSK